MKYSLPRNHFPYDDADGIIIHRKVLPGKIRLCKAPRAADTGLKAVAVLLIGKPAEETDAVSSASVKDDLNAKSVIIH